MDSPTRSECVKLTKEQVMVARATRGRGTSVRQLARQLGGGRRVRSGNG